MNASEISRLAELIEQDSVPLWIREQLQQNYQEIIAMLDSKGEVTLTGPTGEQFVMKKQTVDGEAAA